MIVITVIVITVMVFTVDSDSSMVQDYYGGRSAGKRRKRRFEQGGGSGSTSGAIDTEGEIGGHHVFDSRGGGEDDGGGGGGEEGLNVFDPRITPDFTNSPSDTLFDKINFNSADSSGDEALDQEFSKVLNEDPKGDTMSSYVDVFSQLMKTDPTVATKKDRQGDTNDTDEILNNFRKYETNGVYDQSEGNPADLMGFFESYLSTEIVAGEDEDDA